jgi:hypothetical protein
MSGNVSNVLWKMLANAESNAAMALVGTLSIPSSTGCIGTARSSSSFVRHEEYGVFCCLAEAYLTGNPVALSSICSTD